MKKPPPAKPRAKYGPKEIREATQEVAELLHWVDGETRARQHLKEKLGLSRRRSQRIIDAIYSRWRAQDASRLTVTKHAAIARISAHITRAAQRGAWSAVAALEAQLAKIEGTNSAEQVKIDVDVQMTAMTQYVGQLSSDDWVRLSEELAEQERLAELGRKTIASLPASRSSV
jgi:hypothetical protein